MISMDDKKIAIHEYWMAFRRRYYKIKEGYKPKITHEEIENFILFNVMKDKERLDSIIDEARAIVTFEEENPKFSVSEECNKGKLAWIKKISKIKKSGEE